MLPPTFSDATRAWFEASFPGPTAAQRDGWPAISSGDHTLILAPTGSGKTLSAFLWAIDQLVQLDPGAPPGVRVLYVSPLKALAYDIERNLRAPLAGVLARAMTHRSPRQVRVDIRTGDTPARERRAQAKDPADILVTTPESLYLLLTSSARESLRSVHTVIVDEIHVMASSKRGVHLSLSLERLSELTEREPQRIGLSATQRPIEAAARFLGGARPVTVVDATGVPDLDLEIVVPVADMEHPVDEPPPAPGEELLGVAPRKVHPSIWPAIHPVLLDLIRAHRTTIVFTNSRLLCERLTAQLNELAGDEIARAHHGSISHHQRAEIEEQLKAGTIPAIVATSSLELGIDMGAVDLVVLVESPTSVASGLQRIGRAGHSVGVRSKGRMFPKYRGDLLQAAVVARMMADGAIEPTRTPTNCLDVLAQHVVAMCSQEEWKLDALEAVVKRAEPYRGLTRNALVAVIDMLSGRYPSDDFAELRPRLRWDRATDTISARKGARMLAVLNAGTIPDRGLYAVHLGPEGPRLGELDEEMVYESRRGDTFLLGASTWRIDDITRDRVIVSPAPGEPGRMPFWRGQGPGRPVEVGLRLGELVRTLSELPPEAARGHLRTEHRLDELAAGNLVAYVAEQREVTGVVPTDRAITVECFRDEIGDWRVCILSHFGARVHAPWAMAIVRGMARRTGFEVHAMHTDDGIVLRFADLDDLPELDALFPEPEEVEELVLEELRHSAAFASRFREAAARALLLPRKRPGKRTPLWAQRRRAESLLAVATRFPAFPIVLETYRECLQDGFDLPALKEVLRQVQDRRIRIDQVETRSASPFARSLVFQWVAAWLYETDAPLAERRAQALTLDRALLRELLGHTELRELLDAGVVELVEAELQRLDPERHARDADELHDLLRTLGDLGLDELGLRSTDDPVPWLETLAARREAVEVRIGGETRWIAMQDLGRYRDGLGVVPPPGTPVARLDDVANAFESLILRWARYHGPFHPEQIAARWGLVPAQVEAVLASLVDREALLLGDFRPGGDREEHCHPEVLRQLRRRTLAHLRREVAPVDADAVAPFLAAWQGIGSRRQGIDRLREVVAQLEDLPLPFSVLESSILPARVPGYTPSMLDQLGAAGEVVWVGCGALGSRDGRVKLLRREQVPSLHAPPEEQTEPGELAAVLLQHLDSRGASFLTELRAVARHATEPEVLAALWDLVWQGRITNDTFQPLRSLGAPKRRTARGRGASAAGGRWSPVSRLVFIDVTDTERVHARCQLLLDRYGLISRETALAENVPGGFAALYPVLRVMEETGRIRRGWFVDGLGGAQFALPGAVDRLRSAGREADRTPTLLAATDPANPWGASLPWPDTVSPDHRPRRVAGALVVLVAGRPVLFVDRGGKTLLTFAGAREDDLVAALGALHQGMAHLATSTLRVERVDGQVARSTPLAPVFAKAGFVADHRGLLAIGAL